MMRDLLQNVSDVYTYLVEDSADPRQKHLPLMSSPWPTIFIVVFYNIFVQYIGPELMKNRKPIDVKYPMIIYNIVQIILNMVFVVESFRLIWIPRRYNLLCAPVDYSNDPVESLIFMVLRKKQNQISFLHVYHHSGMTITGFLAAKYVPGGHPILFGTVNSFTHVAMYAYYLLTTLYPQQKELIWWKRHITEIQLAQFIITGVHGAISILNPYCSFPKLVYTIALPQDIFMFLLFWDFYRKTYLENKPALKESEKSK